MTKLGREAKDLVADMSYLDVQVPLPPIYLACARTAAYAKCVCAGCGVWEAQQLDPEEQEADLQQASHLHLHLHLHVICMQSVPLRHMQETDTVERRAAVYAG